MSERVLMEQARSKESLFDEISELRIALADWRASSEAYRADNERLTVAKGQAVQLAAERDIKVERLTAALQRIAHTGILTTREATILRDVAREALGERGKG
jgi:hypothetical protein